MSESQPQQEAVQEEREKQRDEDRHAQNLQQMLAQAEGPRADYLRELMNTDLSVSDKKMLANMTAQDWALANYSEAEVQEIKASLVIIREKFLARHPGRESEVTGVTRVWAYDNPDENIEPLSDKDRVEVDTFLKGVFSRVTRSKDFAQQEILSTSISEVRRNENENNSSGGLIGRWRS